MQLNEPLVPSFLVHFPPTRFIQSITPEKAIPPSPVKNSIAPSGWAEPENSSATSYFVDFPVPRIKPF